MSGSSLRALEDGVRETLIYAINADISADVQTKLIDIFRKIRLSELLDKEEFVSIGGTQGAGKTTLLNTLYKECGMDGWLKGNNGRGEQMPVIVKQDMQAKEIRAERLVYDQGQKQVMAVHCDKDEFIQAVQNYQYKDSDNRATLLVQLIVPAVLDIKFNWMLLPGYEVMTKDNVNWQGLMHYAICHASGMVFVTDTTRIAQNQDKVLKSIKELAHKTTPIIAISRCDAIRNNSEQINELIETASQLYGVDKKQVIAVGTDYENWKDGFDRLQKESLRNGVHTQEDKYQAILKIIEDDLRDVIDEIEEWVANQNYAESANERIIDRHLAVFRDAVQDYKEQLKDSLDEYFKVVRSQALKGAKDRFCEEETGIMNNVGIGIKKLTFNGIQVDERRERRINDAFAQANPQEAILKSIGEVSAKEMSISIGSPSSQNLLGYGEANDDIFEGNWYDVQTALKTLLYREDGLEQELDNSEDIKTSYNNALKLLPAMTMEYVRLSQLVPADAKTNSGLTGVTQESVVQLLQIFATHFNDTSQILTGSAKVVVGGLAAVLGVDSLDGQMGDGVNLEGLGSLVGLSKVAATRLVGGVLVVAGGALVLQQISSHVARNDRKHLSYIDEMIDRKVMAQIQNVLVSYDRAMNQLERQVRENLQHRYGSSNLGNEYNLMVALKQLKQARKDALKYLNAEKVLNEQL